jgi:aspartate 1-decarboxylase
MLHAMCKAKIHRATVTEAKLDYEGSVTIDRTLLAAVGILPYEIVQITNLANGVLWRTYVMPGTAGSGIFCLNGPPARHFHPGDLAIVVAPAYVDDRELASWVQRTAFVDASNRLERVEEHRPTDP